MVQLLRVAKGRCWQIEALEAFCWGNAKSLNLRVRDEVSLLGVGRNLSEDELILVLTGGAIFMNSLKLCL